MRGRPFQAGNTFGRGRPPGSRNKATRLEQELQQYGPSIVKKLALMAIQGDPTAQRLCVERLLPRRERMMETPGQAENVELVVRQYVGVDVDKV